MTQLKASRDPAFAIRREIIDYASLPISSWLPSIDSVSAVLALVQQLSEAGAVKRDGKCKQPLAILSLQLLWQCGSQVNSVAMLRFHCGLGTGQLS